MSVRAYVVTASLDDRMALWSVTIPYANWVEGYGPEDRESWLVTCYDNDSAHFLSVAEQAGATVEEIVRAGETERYVLRAGAPGTGWKVSSGG